MRRDNAGHKLFLLTAILCCAAGCGDGTTKLDTEPVAGVVTLDGSPVEGAAISFVPVNEGQGHPATAYSDASGAYKLTALPKGEIKGVDGAGTTPGEYYVGVVKSVSEATMTEEEAMAKGVKFTGPAAGQAPKMTHVVPTKFNDPRKSGLKVTVKEGDNNIPLELKSK